MTSRLLALALAAAALLVACETHKAPPPARRTAKAEEGPAAGGTPIQPVPAADPGKPAPTPPATDGAVPDCEVVAKQLLSIHTRRIAAAPAADRTRLNQEVAQLVASQKVECNQKQWPADYKRCLVAAQDDGALAECDKQRAAAAPPTPITDANAPNCDAVALHQIKMQRDYLGSLTEKPDLPPEQKAKIVQQIAAIDADRTTAIQNASNQCAQMGFSPALRNCLTQTKAMPEYRMCMATHFRKDAPPGGAPGAPAPGGPPGGSKQPGHEGHDHP